MGRWSEHVRSWLDHKDDEKVVIVKYESLFGKPQRELDKIMKKLSLPSTKEERAEAIEKSTFNKMKDNALRTYRPGGQCSLCSKGAVRRMEGILFG